MVDRKRHVDAWSKAVGILSLT